MLLFSEVPSIHPIKNHLGGGAVNRKTLAILAVIVLLVLPFLTYTTLTHPPGSAAVDIVQLLDLVIRATMLGWAMTGFVTLVMTLISSQKELKKFPLNPL